MRITVFKRSEKGSLYQKAAPAIAKTNAKRKAKSIFFILIAYSMLLRHRHLASFCHGKADEFILEW